jgi:hypothetical protein
MNLTTVVVLASLAVYSWKLIGYLVPQSALKHPGVSRTAGLLTVALLAALLAVQGFTSGKNVEFDERVPALVVAGLLLSFRTPFIVVVLTAAAVTAALRYLNWF